MARATSMVALLALLATSCRPYGCLTEQCVAEAPLERATHCYALYRAAGDVLQSPQHRAEIKATPSVVQSRGMYYLNAALAGGRELGLSAAAVQQRAEQARQEVIAPFAGGTASDQWYDELVDDLANCESGEDL